MEKRVIELFFHIGPDEPAVKVAIKVVEQEHFFRNSPTKKREEKRIEEWSIYI